MSFFLVFLATFLGSLRNSFFVLFVSKITVKSVCLSVDFFFLRDFSSVAPRKRHEGTHPPHRRKQQSTSEGIDKGGRWLARERRRGDHTTTTVGDDERRERAADDDGSDEEGEGGQGDGDGNVGGGRRRGRGR